MRYILLLLLFLNLQQTYGQYPYVKKLNYPDQLPTQVVYDMLTDKQGYIWIGTDKGLFRFNGRNFIAIPFDNTSSKAVSYLQEDGEGVIWCMNFYNQLFSLRKDTLRKFVMDTSAFRQSVTFNNVVVGNRKIWMHSFLRIYVFDKDNGKLQKVVHTIPDGLIVSSTCRDKQYLAYTTEGKLYRENEDSMGGEWQQVGPSYSDFKFVGGGGPAVIGLSTGSFRKASVEIKKTGLRLLPPVALPPDIYLFQAVYVDRNEYWLCTQSGAYQWNIQTGEVHCYLPNVRVTDVVKDYQGNYWFSTLDNGIFVCTSLYNKLVKVYNDPLLDNFTKLALLPNGELLAGNSHGLLVKRNPETSHTLRYAINKTREIEFIRYDSVTGLVFTNRGTFYPSKSRPVEILDYSKGITRDIYGNLLLAVFNGAFVMSDRLGSSVRYPKIACPLYQKHAADTLLYDGRSRATVILRQKRALSILTSSDRSGFWVSYEDGLYQYRYNGEVKEWLDENGMHVIARSLLQQADGSLVAGTTNKGVILFRNGKVEQHLHTGNGLSSENIRKLLQEDDAVWVLTDEGLDRINGWANGITNYFEEYGLNSMVINDFVLDKGKIYFATTTGILLRYNLPHVYNYEIRFPSLRAMNNGKELKPGAMLAAGNSDISLNFEAVHFLSSTALVYQYRLKGLDTAWHSTSGSTNQLFFSRLSPGRYVFEIRAVAGPSYKSMTRSFAFEVPRPFWRKTGFYLLVLLICILLSWFSLRQWKKTLLQKQQIKEELLKSQLVALRAQMNPHFLYNVLNTVQGLVYGNRKTEAGELLGNFSDLMRKTLQASDKQLLPLKDEIENIRLYLELEKARYEEGFTYEMIIEQVEDISSLYVPSLMLQPFVENAVKHGLMHKSGDKKVSISFEKIAAGLQVVIEDNGIGRAQSMEINRRTNNKPFSFATEALTERMDLFNRLYKEKIRYRVIDKFDSRHMPSGTRIELFIPDYSIDPKAL